VKFWGSRKVGVKKMWRRGKEMGRDFSCTLVTEVLGVVEWNGRARHPSVLGGSALVGSSSSGSNSSEVLGERVQVAETSSGVPLRRREWMPPAKCSADSISSGLFVGWFVSFFLSSLAFSLNLCVVPYNSLKDKLS
jgi:hypothetical protein